MFGHSEALVYDAVHSFGDALTAGVVWISLLWAQQPADREHPYGHTRVEAVAGSNVALLLLAVRPRHGLGIDDHFRRTVAAAGPLYSGHRRPQYSVEGIALSV